jgi:hypothetical protein
VRSSAASIPWRQCFPDRLNPRSTSAGSPRADPRGSEAWGRPAPTLPTNATRPRLWTSPPITLRYRSGRFKPSVSISTTPLILLALDVVNLSLSLGQNGTRRHAPPCRTASAAVRAAQSIPEPRLSLKRITHVALIMPDPKPGRFDPGAPFSVKSGEPSCAPPWKMVSSDPRRRPLPDLPWTPDQEWTAEIRLCQSE